jgi:uncharacterized protein with von Willebrand factor type A (vWA) domain
MDIFTGTKLQEQILKQVEEKLGHKLSENELEIFYITARLALIKGEKHGYSGDK